MKSIHRSLVGLSALGVALITSASVSALRPELQLDAPTTEGKVTQLTAQLLEEAQFAHQPLDDDLAAKFLDRYLDTVDPSRELFLQSDIAEFQAFLPKLAEATRRAGDTKPAHVIFDRFLERIEERAAFVAKTLAEGKFDFTGHDQFSFDREDAVRPANISEAQTLWRQRLRAEVLQDKLADKKIAKTVETLTRRYARQVQMMKKFSSDAVLELYLNALAHVYDPHSDYMGREQLQSFNIAMNLSLAGIGATLQSEDGFCKIRELVPGGPAAQSGKLKIGDRIVAVNQPGQEPVDLVSLPLPQAVDLIRGPKGSDVVLTLIPTGAADDARKTVTITRDEIHLEGQQAKAQIVDLPALNGETMRVGVIDLPAFYGSDGTSGPSATADVERLIEKLEREGVQGIVLDLRRNGGGSLEEAINLTGLFIPSGAVVQTRDLAGQVRISSDNDGATLYGGPLIVLTSRFSASASEIVAGALQDYGRALIVGDSSTFGKGTVQTMLPLASIMQRNGGGSGETDLGALKVTISKFYRPSGNSTQLHGVTPDIVLPSFTDTKEISEAGMKNPLPFDTVPNAAYPRFNLTKPFVSTLRDRATARMATGEDFQWQREDLALVDSKRATKSVSLNEAERRRERDEAKARTKTRQAAQLAHQEAAPTVYEITLKNAGEAGLPAPVDPSKTGDKTTAASALTTPSDENDGDAEPETPAKDILLDETQEILRDYVQLLGKTQTPTTALSQR
ncbi:MAG: carboxy terminal-processing peptidase [Chthoniobacteraceae bacterium]